MSQHSNSIERARQLDVPPEQRLPTLPRLEFQIPVSVQLPDNLAMYAHTADSTQPPGDLELVALRLELEQLSLLQGFDELLCLSALRDVDTYWYQVETVRKVLKQFRGRVLLADEVGLGKTIEAGMVLKEYLLRGMVERVLVLTPPSLVGQWRDEMARKFDIPFATSHDSLSRRDPEAFWAQHLVIASIATARRADHRAVIARKPYDLVIVDEAHRLKNRRSLAWKLVDSLQRKFLLLLSATPVQNSLLELYNLLTLLQPGIFQTERQFRQRYMTRGKPRVPVNREQMHELMRSVMIRNTRSLVDIHLPPRHALTLLVDPGDEEIACYRDLMALIRANRARSGRRRLALRHLLSAAGSSAATAAAGIERFIGSKSCDEDTREAWRALHDRYRAIATSGKEARFLTLIRKNPEEKKLVFVHHRETLGRLSDRLRAAGIAHAVFEGGMTGPQRDRAVEAFRTDKHVLLCTESGGEGRNLQFCNTLINFDVPWNPMAIEQRIGRLHRIGQTREVFIFNLVTRHTLEEHVLAILDEKINMFELVVGEIGLILGELAGDGESDQDFAELVFTAWVDTTDEGTRDAAFTELGDRLASAKSAYDASKSLDDELFGEEFVSA